MGYPKVIPSLSLLFFAIATLFISEGCAPRKVVQETKKPEVTQTEARRAEEVKPETEKLTIPEPEIIKEKPVTEAVAKKEAIEKLESPQIPFTLPDIYFDFDRYAIRDDAKPVLEKLATWLKANPSKRVLVEGHCDERGTNQYNLALGERRATSAKNYLLTLGISGTRIDTVTYGEERPVCREQTEECWQLNRRSHFVIHE